ncbi:AfsR/SARP family transcriptional regulator [Streptomyces chryseus]
MIDIQLMPSFQFTHDRRPQPVPDLPRTAIILVALERHHIPRTVLAARLWPDVPEAPRLKRLRNLLWRINRMFPHEAVLTVSQGSVGLSQEAGGVDLHTARDVADSVLRQTLSKQEIVSSPPERWQPLRTPVLVGESSDEVHTLQTEWNHSRLLALDALAAVLLAADRTLLSIEMASAAIKIDHLHESPYRTVTAAFLERNDNATAWRVYQEYTRFIGTELGLTPSDEYQALAARIRV